ncbi:MAG: GNAT family N-acetyltransferase [Rhodospirillaceae bacterium]|nr:GNAT family N-acetyltransferase [Rhodospirillaceae bacterium]MBT7033103.1 GNAT family N-acetyltransferase [Rhodospirillaceae bacterium]
MDQQIPAEIRNLRPDDLDVVVQIDRALTRRSRRGYFENRLKAAIADPDQFIILGMEQNGQLAGYVFARIYDGEFGSQGKIAVLDTIGVDPEAHAKGTGRALLGALDQKLAANGAAEIRTQADWNFTGMLGFFSATGFQLAPAHVLEGATSWKPNHDTLEDREFDDHVSAQQIEPIRSLHKEDLEQLIRIERRITGQERREYYTAKMAEALDETGIRVSLVSEVDGHVAGFIMARTDYGEFGRTEPAAVLDVINVDPGHGHQGIGHALMSQLFTNLGGLMIETTRTTVAWDNFALLGFMEQCGFAPSQRLIFRRTIPS